MLRISVLLLSLSGLMVSCSPLDSASTDRLPVFQDLGLLLTPWSAVHNPKVVPANPNQGRIVQHRLELLVQGKSQVVLGPVVTAGLHPFEEGMPGARRG